MTILPLPAAAPPAFDVAIVGAGPAGAACALALRGSGLRVALLDKARFPRDKVCGDAVPGAALTALARLDPAYRAALGALRPQSPARHSRLVAPSGRSLWLHWKNPSFSSPRLAFDNALLALVRQHTDTEIWEEAAPQALGGQPGAWQLATTLGPLRARLLVGCDGAQSWMRRQLLPAPARPHAGVAVRAYFEHVAGCQEDTTEFFFSRDYLAGYFWLFPVGAGRYNVGLGMLSELVSRHHLDLKKLLHEWVTAHPTLGPRFAQARQLGPTRGFGLPLGGAPGPAAPISGAGFLLCGDAAALIDPLQGHGIDTAVRSGILAAQQVRQACAMGEFGAAALAGYDRAVRQQLGPQLAHSHRLLRLLGTRPWLVNAGVRLAQLPGMRGLVQRLVG
ncbi:geranylgeranyl reductase family protein [Hymenobacter sp. RP-2-7]|uniref:Geranylgeranyl reductase family protein n=1 Tax=Hymenobacter polaris TaxID=2682546 RepID=A0A7Y0FL86_9BACT|nr:geranylgeranyl reductase family protein [Hymenobacter polaris]NML64126.1 geranylgeranyl reductase family protein [Hymenobacter polaris]